VSAEPKAVRTPQQDRSRSTKNRLLDAGQLLICRKGYHGTNSKEIAAEAGTAVGSFYAYFRDKKDLFIAILQRYTQRIFASVPDLPLRGSAGGRAGELLHEYVRNVVRAHDLPELHRELYVVLRNDPDLEVLIDRWQQESVRRLERALRNAAGHLRIRDIQAAAVVLHATLEAVIQRITLSRVAVEEGRLVRESADMFARYLVNDREE
jgi:AcrR family transcriptional regulator